MRWGTARKKGAGLRQELLFVVSLFYGGDCIQSEASLIIVKIINKSRGGLSHSRPPVKRTILKLPLQILSDFDSTS